MFKATAHTLCTFFDEYNHRVVPAIECRILVTYF